MNLQRRVLIVEDDPQWGEVVAALVTLAGYRPEIVMTMGAAVAALAVPAEIVLLDLRLPDSTTEQSLLAIQRLKRLGAGRVLVITGAPIEIELGHYGADAVVPKDCGAFQSRLLAAFGRRIY